MQFPSDYHPQQDLLKDRVILITGAGDGIGRAISLAAAKHGATVILLGKTVSKLEYVYDLIDAMPAPQPAIYPMLLEGASPADFDKLAKTLKDNFGRLDGIVHNAAYLPYLSRLKDYEAEDWMKAMQINVNAPFLINQACYDLLAASDDASVIFTSDTVGAQAKPFWGAYGVSKAAVESLARTWAQELGSTSIRTNLIDPGPTLTALRKRVYPGEDNSQLKKPDTLAPLYLWLLGADCEKVNGERFAYPTG
jgi:NAD(P)-dependent dehydrogenase (short-subunit alcohol dehydrogenase family)